VGSKKVSEEEIVPRAPNPDPNPNRGILRRRWRKKVSEEEIVARAPNPNRSRGTLRRRRKEEDFRRRDCRQSAKP